MDSDGDGLLPINPSTMISSDGDCDDPGEADSSTLGQDCDDNDASAYTGATEIPADGIDQDCDGFDSCPVDADGDGYLGSGFEPDDGSGCDQNVISLPSGDCDDSNADVNTGAVEEINDGIDSDCDGQELCYSDLDGDGFRSTLTQLSADLDCDDANEANASQPEDCDDLDATVYDGATEAIGDGIDQDCDGTEICYVDADQMVPEIQIMLQLSLQIIRLLRCWRSFCFISGRL